MSWFSLVVLAACGIAIFYLSAYFIGYYIGMIKFVKDQVYFEEVVKYMKDKNLVKNKDDSQEN